jgi:hypothetical protein
MEIRVHDESDKCIYTVEDAQTVPRVGELVTMLHQSWTVMAVNHHVTDSPPTVVIGVKPFEAARR